MDPDIVRGLVPAILYGTVSSAMTFTNKALAATYSFKYPIFMLIIQMIVTQIGLLVMHAIGVTRYPRLTFRGLLQHLPVTVLFSFNASLALASLQATSIPTYGVLKRVTPLYIMLLTAIGQAVATARRRIHGIPSQSKDLEAGVVEQGVANSADQETDLGPGVVCGVLVVVAGTMLTGLHDVHLSATAFRLAMASNLTQACYVLMLEAKQIGTAGVGGKFNYGDDVDPTIGLLAHNSLIAVPLCTVLLFVLSYLGYPTVLGFADKSLYYTGLIEMIVFATLLGCALNYTMFLCIRTNSALTTSLVGHAKTFIQTLLGFFFLNQDVPTNSQYITGVFLNAVLHQRFETRGLCFGVSGLSVDGICHQVGGVLFSVAKYNQKVFRGQVNSTPWGWSWWVGGIKSVKESIILEIDTEDNKIS